MTDPRSKSRNTTFSDRVSAYRCASIHLDQGSVALLLSYRPTLKPHLF